MDNLTLIDLRKILQNHNKTLKKKMFKLTGGRAKLLEIVKKNFKVRSKTDKVINIIHKGKQSSYILNLAGTTKRVAEDKKFKDKQDAKKIKAVQNKKKREAKKEEERVIIKAKVLKDILLKEMKKKVKNPKKIKVTKNKLTALERQRKMLFTNKIKIMPKLAKINPKTKESLKLKKQEIIWKDWIVKMKKLLKDANTKDIRTGKGSTYKKIRTHMQEADNLFMNRTDFALQIKPQLRKARDTLLIYDDYRTR
tara:strand:+ start:480 stop:1235 length:756 start_codon:yes stop_codon:yes gene_type:complete